ncbi:MAG: DUF1924 domain-containing protein [Mariprofundaceae bacterium]
MSGKAGMNLLAAILVLLGGGVIAWNAQAAGEALPEVLAQLRADGAGDFDAARGKALWERKFPAPADAEGPAMRSCQTCHGMEPTRAGEHVRTGKRIEPIAPSVNPERFSDAKKIRKWLRRNCKWVLGRQCSPQEKGDVLVYLKDL